MIPIDVLIPSYLRHQSLIRLLNSIQRNKSNLINKIVVHRDFDIETSQIARNFGFRTVSVSEPGVIHAISRGSEFLSSEYVAVFDDDVELSDDWFERINDYLSLGVGAAGGKDLIRGLNINCPRNRSLVGEFTFTGRFIGNHHCFQGVPKSVDFLKGCNFVIKTRFIKNPPSIFHHLKGDGAQVGNDLLLTMSPRQEGEIVVFDPNIKVIHHEEIRVNQDQRVDENALMRANRCFNYWAIRIATAPKQTFWLIIVATFMIGSYETPGILWLVTRHRLKIRKIVEEFMMSTVQFIEAYNVAKVSRSPIRLFRKRIPLESSNIEAQ